MDLPSTGHGVLEQFDRGATALTNAVSVRGGFMANDLVFNADLSQLASAVGSV